MSRTHVHTPYVVKMRQPRWRHLFREEHDHTRGVCDLAHFDTTDWRATRCHINVVSDGTNPHCGCKLCTGQIERRREIKGGRRRQAMADRKAAKQWRSPATNAATILT